MDTGTKIAIGVGAGVVVLGVWAGRSAAAAAKDTAGGIGEAINPTSPDNIFYKGVNAILDIFDDGQDNDSGTLGTKIYDWFHPDEARQLSNQVYQQGMSGRG